ncbi:protein phosphatase 2C domain-containing protein [Janibacter alkaliphilus]
MSSHAVTDDPALPDARTPAPRLKVGAATDVGRVREHNEDAAIAEGVVFAVADGMGGHAAGEVASGIAVDTLREIAGRAPLSVEDLEQQLDAANRRILGAVHEQPERRGMGTTVTGVALVSVGGTDHWAVFNVGDSRVYRWLDGTLSQVTVDHSEVQEMISAGVITPDEARTHPLRNVVTRSLGTDAQHQPDVWVIPPYPGERFVICSDGLTNELDDRDLRELLQEHPDAQQAAEQLVREAVVAGGRDNVTVVVVNLEGEPPEDTVTSPREADERTAPRDVEEK